MGQEPVLASVTRVVRGGSLDPGTPTRGYLDMGSLQTLLQQVRSRGAS